MQSVLTLDNICFPVFKKFPYLALRLVQCNEWISTA